MRVIKKILSFFFAWMAAAVMAVLVVFAAALAVLSFKGGAEDDSVLEAVKSGHGVGVIDLTGEILTSDNTRKFFRRALKNKDIKAIVLRIDSPGGAVGAAEEIYRIIKDADAKKPVVCSLGSIAASGGLYAAVGCRKVVTNAGTLSGSIGVILMMPNLKNAAEKVGFDMNIVKSGKFKDTGSPFRPMTPDDRALLQSLVDASYEQFVDVVAKSRNLPVETVKGFADGRLILGEQAVKLGLADEVGSLQRAAKIALEQTGDQAEPELVFFRKPSGLFSMFDDWRENSMIHWLFSAHKTRLLYQAYF